MIINWKNLYLFIILMIFFTLDAESQSGKIPPFKIVEHNGNSFTSDSLPTGKPVIIVYFSPDCINCDHLTEEMITHAKELSKASVVMITYLSSDEVTKFVTEYKLDTYSNFHIGTEGDSYFVGKYYDLRQIPFIALYNEEGDLIKAYNKKIRINKLISRLNKL